MARGLCAFACGCHRKGAKEPTMPKVTFISPSGERTTLEPPAGLSLLEIARKYNVDIEGACEGSLACSTCHVIVDPEWFDALDTPSEDEEDMLDLAFGLTETSRLGCQIIVTEELDGIVVKLPAETRNMLG
jgi:2Fe-2S ferredoxin